MKVLSKELFYPTDDTDFYTKILGFLASSGFTVTNVDSNTSKVRLGTNTEYEFAKTATKGIWPPQPHLPGLTKVWLCNSNNTYPYYNGMPYLFACFDNGDFFVTANIIYSSPYYCVAFLASNIDSRFVGGPSIFPAIIGWQIDTADFIYKLQIKKEAPYTDYSQGGSFNLGTIPYGTSGKHPITRLPCFAPFGAYTKSTGYEGFFNNYLFAYNSSNSFVNFQHVFVAGKRYLVLQSPYSGHNNYSTLLALDEE